MSKTFYKKSVKTDTDTCRHQHMRIGFITNNLWTSYVSVCVFLSYAGKIIRILQSKFGENKFHAKIVILIQFAHKLYPIIISVNKQRTQRNIISTEWFGWIHQKSVKFNVNGERVAMQLTFFVLPIYVITVQQTKSTLLLPLWK